MLSLAGKRILFGAIDAPLRGQRCYSVDREWNCASAPAKILRDLAGDQEITCEARRIGRLGRAFGVCRAGEVDINRALVAAGMAVALPKETTCYVPAEGIGVWRGPFTAPADYREMLAGYLQER